MALKRVSKRVCILFHQIRKFTGINPHVLSADQLDVIHNGPSLDDFLNNDVNIEPGFAGRTANTNDINGINGNNTPSNLGQKYKRYPKSQNRKPEWLKATPTLSENYKKLHNTVKKLNLATVCEEARCPNIGECWGGKDGTATATIMLMGDTCTRGCRFCNIKTSKAPPPLDVNEPNRVGNAILQWGLDYVVLTSVDRDDLDDGGASHISQTVNVIKNSDNSPYVEVLTPDFSGNIDSIKLVALSGLNVFAHNIETVESLQSKVRDHRANYEQSMFVLKYAKDIAIQNGIQLLTKTSVMLGCGEKDDEVIQAMKDLRDNNVDIITFGQYLQPSRSHMKVHEYVDPTKFEFFKNEAENFGFLYVASGPLVRSSYKAGEYFLKNYLDKQSQK